MRELQKEHVPKLPEPININWDREGPWDLEIGCGKGLHSIRYAMASPERNLIAVERTKEKYQGFYGRMARHQELGRLGDNLIAVYGDAVNFLVHETPEREIFSRVFILYPNPYPKKKQANKRWHYSSAMSLVISRLLQGGTLQCATNLSWYADECRTALDGMFGLRLMSYREITSADVWTPRTHFEKKYLANGETCFDMIFVKEESS